MTKIFKPTAAPGPARDMSRFLKDEDGAITVDWVVLTGFIVFLGIATSFYVATSVPMVADKTKETMEAMTVMPD